MKRKGFTLIELLVVVAIIALLISILLPSLSRARELAKRAVCASNQKDLGTGMYIYANDNEEWFPAHFFIPEYSTTGPPEIHKIQWVEAMGSTTTLKISQATTETTGSQFSAPSRSLFLMVIGGQSTPDQFICPSSSDSGDDLRNRGSDSTVGTESAAQPGVNRFDFRGYSWISYGYQMPFGRRGKPHTNKDSRLALTADKGPYYTAGSAGIDGSTQTDTDEARTDLTPPSSWESLTIKDLLRKSQDDWRPYNSLNHGGEGQNVMFVDGHVKFENKPTAGIANDNIYTYHHTDLGNIRFSVVGQVTKKGQKFGPSTNTDAFIVP
jgi:prepilin-type N-terminal cleavage/methylation domain-containing protein/prepilin-type processing-associated H-X9-DG protein